MRACIVGGAVLVLSVAGAGAAEYSALETDWLRQLDLRLDTSKSEKASAPKRNPTTAKQDAGGAVDGTKDGKWGLHTAHQSVAPDKRVAGREAPLWS